LIKNREQHHENGAFDNGASAGPVQLNQRIPTPGSASGEKPSEIELEDLSANSPSSSASWSKPMHQLTFAAINYRTIRDRIREEDPQIDEQTLADTVEGLTDLHEIVTAIIRSALADEALATGLKCRIADMQVRLDRVQDRASKRRQIAKDVMVELDLKKITAPDFTVSIRPGTPSLLVLDEAAVPSIYWQPSEPRLNRQMLASELKEGAEITGVTLSYPEPVLSVRTR
jgi:Siphovirus Gp157